METLVDPAVSRRKFDREVALYKNLERLYCARGWFLVKAEYPEIFIVFGAPKANPSVVVLGALLDFSNYDLWPPSLRIVNAFTREPYNYGSLPTKLDRNVGIVDTPIGKQIQAQALMQPGYTPNALPFFCIPGVREYHEHPAHSGDSWLQHRGRGEGTLSFILEQISKYGIDPIKGFQIEMAIKSIRLDPGLPPT